MAGSVAKAYVQVIPSAEGIKGKLSGVFNSEMPSAGEGAGNKFGSSMIGKIKGLVAAAGIGKLLASSITAGGDMQQSLGGIETLFKGSADTVVKNAEQAYKTAGMSANQYMETVTGFSASLLQGLSGDTEKAASIADMALTDMSDNANKMGTDMESIQYAYQGFAKQNYTMLDNLKLGYGGTKTEMERLLADAQKLTGIKYDISNLADVYSAIHVIQEEMGITGTTAKEAATTLQGSLSSMKAAFSDVLANLSLGRDIGPSLNALGETVFTFLSGNLIPMTGNILQSLPEVISGALSLGVQGLNLVANNMDAIVQMGIDLVTGVGSAIVTALPYLGEAALQIVSSLGSTLVNTDWAQIGEDTIRGITESLDIAAGEILGTDGNIVQSILDAIATGFPNLLETGGMMVEKLVGGIFSALPGVVDSALNISVQFANTLLSNLPKALSAGKNILLSVVSGIRESFPDILRSAGDAVASLLSGLVSNWPEILAGGYDLIVSLIEGIGDAYPDILAAGWDVARTLWDTIKSIDWIQLGVDLISGMIDGILSMGSALWNAAKRMANSAMESIKETLGIASPSKVMRDKVGRFIPSGVAVGIKENVKPLTDTMAELSEMTVQSVRADMDISGAVAQLANVPVAASRTLTDTTGGLPASMEMALEDFLDGNMAGHRATVEVLGQLLEAVRSIHLGDDDLAAAVRRSQARRAVMKGGGYAL